MPRAFTRRLAKERTWRVWAQEWRDLEHGSGMDMGEDKAYLRFAPTLEDIKEAVVWKAIGCFSCCQPGGVSAQPGEAGRGAV